MSDIEAIFLAQLLDAPSSDTRRTALPTEALSGQNRELYRAMLACSHECDRITPEAVVAELTERGRLGAAGGADRVHDLTRLTGMSVVDGARADLVAYASQRILMDAAAPMHSLAKDGQTRDAADMLRDALRVLGMLAGSADTVEVKSMSQLLREWAETARDFSAGEAPPVVQMGAFEANFGEVDPGCLCLIYGFSQTGKSHLMQYMERQYARAGYPTLRLSCEDPDRVNAGRLMSEVSGVDAMRVRKMTRGDWQKISHAMGEDDATRDIRYIVEHPARVETCCQTIRTASAQRGVKVVFVDYIQLLHAVTQSHSDSSETRLSAATAMLKDTAKECGVQLWLGSQVTVRDPKPGRVFKPTKIDLKGARSIYEMSECAIALWAGSDGHRYAEVQKDKIGGSETQARLVVGAGGVITDLEAMAAPNEQQAARERRYGSRGYLDD